ncbi:DNA phosphorothioation-dependent restriction protein DptH [Flavobacterium sp. D11R37]|uniref:DNA phosphorothioation-dependent restriction protein DptH n=1 Tax=Flavobacterium coralii TaxID=2838017 RepID=UPI001CA6F69E|nr:DNA phosphorothioation-dependent restriction protein DptH [Flavobacterium coralii]MBY8961808.1 DNA phosphorothioation-dependent restriction protein DptH [Flavobacterium coralii]
MHNTLSPLYNYITSLIIEFFKVNQIQAGERYNFYLEEKSYVNGLFMALEAYNGKLVEFFEYKHPSGDSFFKSFSISINGVKVVVASSEHATEDYFTMLRNNCSDQVAGFENTALLFLYSQKLDSISGGSGNLEKEGMPLHYVNFRSRLESDISKSKQLQYHEKEVLKEVLHYKTRSVLEDNNSVFDYEGVVNLFLKGTIKHSDYCVVGLFPHEELSSKGNAIADDIRSNYRLYEKIENIFLDGEPETDLREFLPDNAVSRLIKEDWKQTDYATLVGWIGVDTKNKAPEIISVSCPDEEVTFWKRADGTTATKKRQYSCIIFNSIDYQGVQVEVRFDQRTSKDGIVSKDPDLNVHNAGKSLFITFSESSETSRFHLVEYRDIATKKKYSIKFLHAKFESKYLQHYETNFQVVAGTTNELLIKDESTIIFNEDALIKEEKDFENDTVYDLYEDESLQLVCDYSRIDEEQLHFEVRIGSSTIPICITPDFEPPKPITGLDVWKEKRIHESDFLFKHENEIIKIQLKTEQQERTVSGDFRRNLLLEKAIVHSDAYSWFEGSNEKLTERVLELDDKIKKAFDDYRSIFVAKDLQPSLAFINSEERRIAVDYVFSVMEYLQQFFENQSLTPEQKNVFLLGVITENDSAKRIKFTPFHPLNVAYQLGIYQQIGKDLNIYDAILKRLQPTNLLPYLSSDKREIFVPTDSSHSPEWQYFSIYSDSKQDLSKNYVSLLVNSKLADFKKNFEVLFKQSIISPIKINVVNQGDCREVLRGIFEFYRAELYKGKDMRLEELTPIELSIYGSENLVNKFEEITYYTSSEEIEEQFDINLKLNSFDKEDFLSVFFDKVKFFSKPLPGQDEEYDYAHITFYEFSSEKSIPSYNEMTDVRTGLSLDGLLSDVSFVATQDNYRTGFGTRYLPSERSALVKLAILYNALAKVAYNDDPYDSSKALCTTINYNVRADLEQLYVKSHWVTYIDPRVDLDFFKDRSDLLIIHYSDQYTNSSGYDSITVSRKTSQYSFVVDQFLKENNIVLHSQDQTIPIINFFNAVNGSWLLSLVRQRSHFPKEKLSLLSGVKAALTFLNVPGMIWIPISLEEILRVSGNAGLTKEEGLFSAKNLGGIGSYSDDILMIGLEMLEERLFMHFYPVELKIGGLNLANKGKVQGERTASLLYDHLSQNGFTADFYKNFFAKLVLVSAEKMKLFQIWENQNWDTVIKDYRAALLNNEFTISKNVEPYIGTFGLIHFRLGDNVRSMNLEANCLRINLLYADGFNFLIKTVDELLELFHKGTTTIRRELLLANTYQSNNIFEPVEKESEVNDEIIPDDFSTVEEIGLPEPLSAEEEKSAEGMKIAFGTEVNYQHPVFWEPNNTDKVLHTNTGIIGTMGTGKTQFTKSVITQLFKSAKMNPGNQGIGVLIFDYKGDYIKEDFVKATDAKVYEPHRLPYNPLSLDGATSRPMLPLHTANDIKETISSAFNLGHVQKQRLFDIIIRAYESKGIERGERGTWSKEPPTFEDICNLYLSDSTVPQDSLYSALSYFSNFQIFEPDSNKTKSLYSLINGVIVINLSGYDPSIQNLIVAVTLDAFYTQMQRHGHSEIKGNLRQLRKIILVDEADNFLSKDFQSLKKILKEGREFGVGTILSTQFLNHFATSENEYSNYILTWVIHRVNEIKMKEVESLFALESKIEKEALIKTIKGLEKHHSVVNLGGSNPIVIKDKAFWELDKN